MRDLVAYAKKALPSARFRRSLILMKNRISSLRSGLEPISSSLAFCPSRFARCALATMLSRRLASLLFFLSAVLLMQPCAATPFQWEYTGSLNIARRYQSGIATQLLNGKVLVEGGSVVGDTGLIDSPTAELYDLSTGTWTLTGSLNNARFLHTATRLSDGKVLVAAGADIAGGFYFPIASAELYDPATGTWTVTGSLNTARLSHTAT